MRIEKAYKEMITEAKVNVDKLYKSWKKEYDSKGGRPIDMLNKIAKDKNLSNKDTSNLIRNFHVDPDYNEGM